ncbi:protein jag [Patescibacteria group bacterium]
MIGQNNSKKIQNITEEFFKKMTVEAEIKVGNPQDSTFPIDIKIIEPKILVGERGQTLAEVQHLLKLIIRRKLDIQEQFYISLDVNDYKKKKMEYLKELARTTADEVSLSKEEKHLMPMPAYERRIIHLELASRPDIATESIGETPERRVVIRPYP